MSINNEPNLLNKNIVYDLTPFSHLDYPDHLSCIVWLIGCNFRCDYCYNKDIVFAKKADKSFSDVLSFLDTRKNLLDGVVISGGEALGHDIIPFCKEVKSRGFKIKIDTNGTNYSQIMKIIDLKLVDYIALDYKAPKDKFLQLTHSTLKEFDNFSKTLDYLIKSKDLEKFEVRTTVHGDLLTPGDINKIIDDLSARDYKGVYYLQNFLEADNIGDLQKPDIIFDLEKLQVKNSTILIQYRNF